MTRIPTGRSSLVKFGLIFTLYMSQGTATGFLVAGFPSVMRALGLPLEILWVAFMPPIFYSTKFLWAPLADRYWIRSLGRRRTWLLPAALGLSASFLVLARFPPDQSLVASAAALLLIGLCGANLDIATDAYAVEMLNAAERGIGNGLQSAGLVCGAVIGDGVMLVVVDNFGWANAMVTLAVAIPLIAAPALIRREPPPPVAGWDDGTPDASLLRFLRRPEAPAMLVLGLATGLCYYLVFPIVGPFLVDSGLSLTQVGLAVGIVGTAAGVLGALLGGVSINFFG
ncbi:MAG: MFS transporter, partial [Gemmatimonadota bacterium]|nr:MFS transporter [Gemmatimonadota bacterium]